MKACCKSGERPYSPGHSTEQIRLELVRIFADPKVEVRYVDDARKVYDHTPDKNAFPPILPPTEILAPLAKIADEMWNGVPMIPEMETGASNSVYTVAAGLPSYGIGGIAIDPDDVLAHGLDERVRANAFYDGVELVGNEVDVIERASAPR